MRVACRFRSLITLHCPLLLLVACGSGNLGTVVEKLDVVRPQANAGSAAFDAGQADANGGSAGHGWCGDGILETSRGEQCDGDRLADRSCMSLGLGSGVLGCDAVTCQVVTTSCTQDAGGVPVPVGAAGGGGGGAAGGSAGAGGNGGVATCPSGFTCRAVIGQTMQSRCMEWAEDTPPLCFSADSGDCASLLPGSTCTDTNRGMYCVLACTP